MISLNMFLGDVYYCKIPFYGRLSYYKNVQFHGDFVGFKLRCTNFFTDNWYFIRIRYEDLVIKIILWDCRKMVFAFYYFKIYIIIHLRFQFGKVVYAKTFLFSEYFLKVNPRTIYPHNSIVESCNYLIYVSVIKNLPQIATTWIIKGGICTMTKEHRKCHSVVILKHRVAALHI